MSLIYLVLFLIFWWCFATLLGIKPIQLSPKAYWQGYQLGKPQYKSFTEYLIKGEYRSEIPRYKFFGEIIFQLVALRKRYGVDIKEACREIRKAAQKDNRESKRINSEFYGLVAQYAMVGGFTWFFISHVQLSLGIEFPIFHLWLLFGWQFLGLALGAIIFLTLKKRIFGPISSFFFTSYIFRSLIFVSRPVNEILESSKLKALRPNKALAPIKERFLLLISELKVKGTVPMDEFTNIISELWDHYDDQLLVLKKAAGVLKLVLILFFVFPGFLLAIYMSMQGMGM